jgi:hypothetical protein
MSKIIDVLFGCDHDSMSRVFTGPLKRHRANKHWPRGVNIGSRTYRVCLDCGREFDFDWQGLGSIESGDGLRISEVVTQ